MQAGERFPEKRRNVIGKDIMVEEEIARLLLASGAIQLNIKEPFTYASGIRSPIYCDCRKLLGIPDIRSFIANRFVEAINFYMPAGNVICAVLMAGLPWAAIVAQEMKKPLAYVRKKAKSHGVCKRIEGCEVKGQNVTLIEDLVSTGKSSMDAEVACLEAGAASVNIISIFSYELFRRQDSNDISLSNFTALMNVAQGFSDAERTAMKEWAGNPKQWGPDHGFENQC